MPMSKSSKRAPSRPVKGRIIRARAPAELLRALEVWAKANGVTLSDFLREAAEHYLAHLDGGGGRLTRNPDGRKSLGRPSGSSN